MQDGNWNTIAICDITGSVGELYAYSAYGVPIFMTGAGTVQSASAIGFEILYTGYRFDDASSQIYDVRNRFLLPMIGTWNRRDPLGYIDGANLYAYASDRPMNNTDPFGLQTAAQWGEIVRLLQLIAAGGAVAQAALAALRALLASIPAVGWVALGLTIGLTLCLRRGAKKCSADYATCIVNAETKAGLQVLAECPDGSGLSKANELVCFERLARPLRRRCHIEMSLCMVRCGFSAFHRQSTAIPGNVSCEDLCERVRFAKCSGNPRQYIS